MKMMHINVVALSLLCVQVTTPARIKIVQHTPKDTWSYQVQRQKSTGVSVENDPLKTFKKKATITFDDKQYEVIIKVYQNRTASGQHKDVELIKDGQKLYGAGADAKNILVDKQGYPRLVDKDAPPFAKTKKVAVEKMIKDNRQWTIRSKNALSNEKMDWQYGEVKIRKDTMPGFGLEVPRTRAFSLSVDTAGKGTPTTEFTAGQALELRKIKINSIGRALPYDARGRLILPY